MTIVHMMFENLLWAVLQMGTEQLQVSIIMLKERTKRLVVWRELA